MGSKINVSKLILVGVAINMGYHIRKATESEKSKIARTFAYSFEADFSGFAKGGTMDSIANAFEPGVNVECFLVAEQANEIVGIISCVDSTTNRAFNLTAKNCRKHLGLIRGTLAFGIFYEEFLKPLTSPKTSGYIDCLGVLEEARGQGIAKALLEKTAEFNPEYSEFILDVTDNNDAAIRLYKKFGFVEYERIPYKFAKHAPFDEKVWMRYTK